MEVHLDILYFILRFLFYLFVAFPVCMAVHEFGLASLILVLTIINLIIVVKTSIPRIYPEWQGAQGGIPSDGLQLVQLVR
jgi:hypothetical protein